MLRSLYSAVSGVKAHQTYLDVTGNNIANVNTVGFKRDVIHFRDMIYQTIKNASAPDNSIPIGGVNPAQVGLGVAVGSIETVHTGGSLQSTGIPTDMAIQGSGYFVVENGQQRLYTRAGNFAMDRDGNLVMSGNGYKVQGYAYVDQIDPATGNTIRVKDASLTGINIPIGQKTPAKATTLAAFRCNLCSTSTAEIPDLGSIPGGENKILRPHDYIAYGGVEVTYIGATGGKPDNTTVKGVSGDTFYDTTGQTIYDWDTTAGDWVASKTEVKPYTYYYGTTLDGGVFAKEYSGGGPVVSARVTVGLAQAGGALPDLTDPQVVGALKIKPGTTLLDTSTGKIYKVKSTVPAGEESSAMEAGTAYAVRDSTGIYVLDKNADPVEVFNVLDSTSGAKNVFRFDEKVNSWFSINNTKDSDTALSPSSKSVTTQEIITEFGESMIKSRDWEDKFTVYDSLGNAHTMIVAFRKVLDRPAEPGATLDNGEVIEPSGAEAEWDWYAYYVDSSGKVQPQYGQGAGTMVFGDDGLLKRTYYYEPTPANPDPEATANTAPEYNWRVVEKVIDKNDPRYNASIHDNLATGKVVADFNVSGAEGSVQDTRPLSYASNMITLDFLGSDYAATLGLSSEPIDGVTQYGSASTTKMKAQDGYAMGELNDWTVSANGVITGIYSNGRTLEIAQLALASFANPQGLTKVGETCFAESINSGLAQIGTAQSGGNGSIQGNSIEMSNVDLSEEFVNLIKAQRGFQANTRVVTTSDQVLEELINMKR